MIGVNEGVTKTSSHFREGSPFGLREIGTGFNGYYTHTAAFRAVVPSWKTSWNPNSFPPMCNLYCVTTNREAIRDADVNRLFNDGALYFERDGQ
jgi:hypothetical protein